MMSVIATAAGDLTELVEDDGAVCEVCGEPLLRGQEVRWVNGQRGHVDDWARGASSRPT